MEEEKKHKEIELRSEEVQEVMNHVPSWILRCGITVLFCIVMVLLAGSYLFKYPDVVQAEITLSTQNPPAYVLARASGRIDSLYGVNGSVVVKDETLAVIENAARAEDMALLKQRMKQWADNGYALDAGEQIFDRRHLQLGEVQAVYSSFVAILSDYCNFVKLDYYRKKLSSSKKQLEGQEMYYELAQKQYRLAEQEQVLAKRMYGRDSTLYKRNAMIAAEYDQSERSYLQNLQSKESSRMSLTQVNMQIEQGRENLLDISRQAQTEEQKYAMELKNTTEQLKVQITAWEQHYLLIAPITGNLTFMSVWSRNQNVETGETVFVVAPAASSSPVGKALLPVQGSGKVKAGQQVNIRLNNYPDQEFGYVRGEVRNVSPVPTAEGLYVVDVALPEGLHTNYGKELPVTRDMKGSAEIITEDMRLIERLLSPLKKLKGNF